MPHNLDISTYKRHRFPPEIISYSVWLYFRFNLSHRDIDASAPSAIAPSIALPSGSIQSCSRPLPNVVETSMEIYAIGKSYTKIVLVTPKF